MPGIYRDGKGRWCVDKVIANGPRLRERFGSCEEAQTWLLEQLAKLKTGAPTRHTFDQAAAHYVTLYHNKVSFELEQWLLKELVPYLGPLFLDQVYDATLEPFKAAMRTRGWKSNTLNLALGVVRRILNLAARSWRDERGKTWLGAPPLLTMVDRADVREPMQLTWAQQRRLLPLLPDHLARMVLFDLQCGARDAVVCGLRWDWEVRLAELGVSAFVVPRPAVKGRKHSRVVVCNSIAQSIIESVRGQHPQFVFMYSARRKKCEPGPIETMNNTAWQRARKEAGLGDLHVHDLRHTVGLRLREANVEERTISDILWHTRSGMTAHYSVAQVREIHAALELIADERHGWNRTLASIAQDVVGTQVPTERKSG
jgi:integrase